MLGKSFSLVLVSTLWAGSVLANPLFLDSGQNLTPTRSLDIALGDVDNDGDLDAVIANDSGDNNVWLNDGAGYFSGSQQSFGKVTYSIALGDVDGDNDLDAFTVTHSANQVWLNDGAGHFRDSGQLLGDSHSYRVVLGDIDNDNDLDAFVINYEHPDKLWLNDGNGYFISDSGHTIDDKMLSFDIALGDVDGDGFLDAFMANLPNKPNKVWLSDGNSHFIDSEQNLSTSYSRGIALGDIDNDGDLDAFITNYNQPNQVWFNDKTGIFTDSGQNLNASYSQRVALGDLDGDGFLDAFVSNHKGQPDKIWLNDGKGYFQSGQSIGNSNSYSVALGDLDGDNDLDAFVSVWKGYNKVWLNQSNQSDTDDDSIFNGIDNNPTVENPNQTDSDSDSDSVIESNDTSQCVPVIYSATDKRVTFDSIVIELYNPITDEPNGQFAVFTGGDMSLVTLSGFSNFTYQGGKPVYAEQIVEASNNCYPTYSFQQKTIYFPKVKIPLVGILPNWKTVEGPSACYQAWLKESNTQAQVFILTQMNEVACQ